MTLFRSAVVIPLIVLAAGLLFLIQIQDILLPFITALIVAYFLDPVADHIEEMGVSRGLATFIISVAFFILMLVVTILLLPVLYDQIISFANKLPGYVSYFHHKLAPLASDILQRLDSNGTTDIKEVVSQSSAGLVKILGKFLGNILQSGLAVINLLSLVFITPIVSFYILRDWDKMVAKVDSYLPPQYRDTIHEQCQLIDQSIAGYIRGQTLVCLILGTFYAIGLTLADLDFGLFIGLGTGLLSFIPYVGILFGMVVGLGIAFVQFGDFAQMGIILAIFIIGQIIEGNFITPKLVGDRVGLHPVWIIFGMLAGAALFGFIGILVAVPVTAIIGVLVRFALNQYLASQTKNVPKKKGKA